MRLAFAAAACLLFLLTGCSLATTAPSAPEIGSAIRGQVHGGQQAIVGAHVYLYAANTTGYGGNGIAAGTTNASVSLLTNSVVLNNPLSSGVDTSGNYYVTTGAYGLFSITGDYTCSPGQQVYVYAVGGNPGGGTNSSAALLTILGSCPASGSFATATPFVFVNEVSTVAAAYAFAGFATDATHVSSSGSALAQTGIANAFANAANIASLSTGAALTYTPGNVGIAPQSTVNTLANLLAACINSADIVSGLTTSPSGSCTSLFSAATADGTSSGTHPSDTATAAINIAHNPGSNVGALFGLPSPTSPFAPALSTQPNDFTLALAFPVTGSPYFTYPTAIDSTGSVWFVNQTVGSQANEVRKLSPAGATIIAVPAYTSTDGGLTTPNALSIDTSDNVWVVNTPNGSYGNNITELTSTGAPASGSPFSGSFSTPVAIAFDNYGNAWIPNKYSNTVTQLTSAGAGASGSPFSATTLAYPQSAQFDGAGNLWVLNSSAAGTPASPFVTKLSTQNGLGVLCSHPGSEIVSSYPEEIHFDAGGNAWYVTYYGSVYKLASDCTVPSSYAVSGGSIVNPNDIAVDGAGTIWVAHGNGLTRLSANGTAYAGTPYNGGFETDSSAFPRHAVIDGSGNLWAPWRSIAMLEFVGIAAPVVTPIAAASKNNSFGTRP